MPSLGNSHNQNLPPGGLSSLKTLQFLCILTLLKETVASLTMSVPTMTGWTKWRGKLNWYPVFTINYTCNGMEQVKMTGIKKAVRI